MSLPLVVIIKPRGYRLGVFYLKTLSINNAACPLDRSSMPLLYTFDLKKLFAFR